MTARKEKGKREWEGEREEEREQGDVFALTIGANMSYLGGSYTLIKAEEKRDVLKGTNLAQDVEQSEESNATHRRREDRHRVFRRLLQYQATFLR